MLGSQAPLNLWLYSSDLERSRAFYGGLLGLPLWREEPGRSLHFGLGGALLSIHAAASGRPDPRGVSVLVPCGRELDQVCSALSERGIALDAPLADREFGRSAMIRDPDGYEIWIARPSATETQFLRWRLSDRTKSRRIPVNRRVTPRRHVKPAATRRTRHPET
jgi:lactoylglutathione lyase